MGRPAAPDGTHITRTTMTVAPDPPGALDVLLCTQNPHKLAEFGAVFPGWGVEPLAALDYPPEDGATYFDNALLKARFGRDVAPDRFVLADDSGIELDALGGRPGVHTARWAEGEHVRRALAAVDGAAARGARYVCELVLLTPDGRELRGTGTLEGAIALEPRGGAGFGFDPVFVPAGEELTVAQLGEEWKARHSHRALAARALLGALYG
jgi:XTP/dITP diphosphohydrolase